MSKQKIYKTPPNERTNKGVQKTDPKIHVGGKRPRTGNVRGRTRLGGPPPAGRAPHEAAVRVRRNQHRAPRLRRGSGRGSDVCESLAPTDGHGRERRSRRTSQRPSTAARPAAHAASGGDGAVPCAQGPGGAGALAAILQDPKLKGLRRGM